MSQLTLVVHRNMTAGSSDSVGQERYHRERAQLLHEMVDSLGLSVVDWGDTDAERPREVVEVILALGSAGAFSALVAMTQAWLARRKIKELEIRGPKGSITLRGASARDVAVIAESIGFEMDD